MGPLFAEVPLFGSNVNLHPKDQDPETFPDTFSRVLLLNLPSMKNTVSNNYIFASIEVLLWYQLSVIFLILQSPLEFTSCNSIKIYAFALLQNWFESRAWCRTLLYCAFLCSVRQLPHLAVKAFCWVYGALVHCTITKFWRQICIFRHVVTEVIPDCTTET